MCISRARVAIIAIYEFNNFVHIFYVMYIKYIFACDSVNHCLFLIFASLFFVFDFNFLLHSESLHFIAKCWLKCVCICYEHSVWNRREDTHHVYIDLICIKVQQRSSRIVAKQKINFSRLLVLLMVLLLLMHGGGI